ncbi:GDSL-type esterase/lipase family protein [Zavarzinia aquatilis]|uniref:GDSL-type esterase/lipase family protein n=1 Tax=Zavarzinia aquatilis TaxID=2211142 RepID=UPI0014025424|nr:GDSL-type esterase/lipase family protein [Zavarzinia aquatilis]
MSIPFRGAPLPAPSRRAALIGLTAMLGGLATGRGAMAGDVATTPLPRLDTGWWAERHRQKLEEIRKGRVDLIFVGDSITHDYELPSEAPQYDFLGLWRRMYGGRNAVNLGFNGDTTANVLWRLQNGEIDGIAPKAAVVLIGTNNTIQGQSAEETEAGIVAVLSLLAKKLPRTKILLLGILPSDVSPLKTALDQTVNLRLGNRYAGSRTVTFMDVSYLFLKDGVTDTSLFMDPRNTPPLPALHPDAAAQGRMAEAIEPTLAALLGEKPKP